MKFNRLILAYALAFAPILNAYAATNSGISIQAQKFPIELMETDVAAVVAGGQDYGWVSGTPASAAASSNPTAMFDLGPDWKQYTRVQANLYLVGPSTTVANIQFFSRDDATNAIFNNRRLGYEYAIAANGNFVGSAITPGVASGVTYNIRPMGRYLIIAISNTDASNALGATSKFTVAAYPN